MDWPVRSNMVYDQRHTSLSTRFGLRTQPGKHKTKIGWNQKRKQQWKIKLIRIKWYGCFCFGRVCVRAVRINRLVPIHIHNNKRFLGWNARLIPVPFKHTHTQHHKLRLPAFIFRRPKQILDLFCCFPLVGDSIACQSKQNANTDTANTYNSNISGPTRYRISCAELGWTLSARTHARLHIIN